MTISKITTSLAASLAATMLASPAHASLNDQFRCEPAGDGEHLVIFDAHDSNRATVQYQLSSENAAPSNSGAAPIVTELRARYNYPESGARYEGGEYLLLTTNKTAVLIYGADGGSPGHTECRFVGEEPEENMSGSEPPRQKQETSLNVAARSWGGKLRSGPGMHFDQIGSLREGEHVTLIANGWIEMNGNNWFKIRRANGQEGYKWGGILCSNAAQVPGLYDQCME